MTASLVSKTRAGASAACALAAVVAAAWPGPAHACGGLFCSSSNPVNQAAERILFVENGDGTVTAVIQILYEGPAHKFAWVLPVAGEPKVGVSSNSALAMLQQITNPTYRLIPTVEGTCGGANFGNGARAGSAAPSAPMQAPGVQQVAAGSVGPYDYTVISVTPGIDAPETAAIEWLGENGYDVAELGPELLRPYLLEGLNLIAFKLQKGTDTGSIRPVMLTYDASRPSIPIRPTAVAANDDMGVLVWTLAAARGVPANYKALELNEALIDWFNPSNNYDEVVTRAADEAMGQGFVTEFAGRVDGIAGGLDLFPEGQEQQWNGFLAKQYANPLEMLEASQPWSAWDGYDDARRLAVTLPETLSYDDFVGCPPCYIDTVAFDTQRFMTELYELVIKPMIETDELMQSRPYLTRLYTTMSAEEMTVDPLFEFNSDLPDVSNVHVASRFIPCGSDGWRTVLPTGVTVYGRGGSWPVAMDSQPAAMKILEYGTSGMGRVIEDRTEEVPAVNGVAPPLLAPDAGPGGQDPSVPPDNGVRLRSRGCSAGGAERAGSLAWLLLACAALLRRARA